MQKFNFSRGHWNPSALTTAYSFRFTETPVFAQEVDCISGGPNPSHREGFDNISLLGPVRGGPGARATLRCAFEDTGCPEIIFVEQPESCEDGAVRYGACFEVVLYKNGINIWRHYRDNGRCHWHKRLGVEFPVAEGVRHELTAQITEGYLIVHIDGRRIELRVDDMFERFHVGVTACEGIVRLYDLQIEEP